MKEEVCLSVSDFVGLVNQTMEYAYSGVLLEGEVASFKINQGKFVFFDLKDEESSVGCFMMKFALRFPLADGMKIRVKAIPKLTKWGKFSLTIVEMVPVGEGTIKKSLELLKDKLKKEGLFDKAKKRALPDGIEKIGVISSTQAAGYADFIKILNERWGGLKVQVAHTQVQGMGAADQIIKALKYFNEKAEVQVIVIIRGGGSADDLAVFNDEVLAREIAGSRIITVTGIGHEVDESIADLVADIVASTPSNAAQMLTKDKRAEIENVKNMVVRVRDILSNKIVQLRSEVAENMQGAARSIVVKITTVMEGVLSQIKILEQLNPDNVLKRGYAIVRGVVDVGNVVKITTIDKEIKAEIKDVRKR